MGEAFVNTKRFTLIVSVMTAIVCIMIIVYNFASMPAYGSGTVSAEPVYSASSTNSTFHGSSNTQGSGTESNTDTSGKTAGLQSGSGKTSSSKQTSNKASSTASKTPSGPVNINTASESELESVSYLGPTKAQAIIDYRNSHGSFKSVDELDNVKGIGAKTIEKIRQYLTT
jgi:competence protein ComEA